MLIVKYLVSAAIVVIVSEIARRTERLGAFLGALPLVSLLIIFWLYVETRDSGKIAEYALYTFWYVLPTLPMFLLVPYLLKQGWQFWAAILAGLACTLFVFVVTALIARKFGITLIP